MDETSNRDSGLTDPEAGSPPDPGPVLGIDLGDARIGVAISDPDARVAVPLGTIHVGQPPGELKAVASLVREHGVRRIVIGHPLSMSGQARDRADHAASFAEALRAVVDVPVELHDERLSTAEAERRLAAAGVTGSARRRVVDQTAAAVILGAWLDAHRPASEPDAHG